MPGFHYEPAKFDPSSPATLKKHNFFSFTSLQLIIPGKLWGIGRGLDVVLPFTCYSYWFSCYFDQRGKLMKALTCNQN
jgi:hypothetical protein